MYNYAKHIFTLSTFRATQQNVHQWRRSTHFARRWRWCWGWWPRRRYRFYPFVHLTSRLFRYCFPSSLLYRSLRFLLWLFRFATRFRIIITVAFNFWSDSIINLAISNCFCLPFVVRSRCHRQVYFIVFFVALLFITRKRILKAQKIISRWIQRSWTQRCDGLLPNFRFLRHRAVWLVAVDLHLPSATDRTVMALVKVWTAMLKNRPITANEQGSKSTSKVSRPIECYCRVWFGFRFNLVIFVLRTSRCEFVSKSLCTDTVRGRRYHTFFFQQSTLTFPAVIQN